MTRSLRRRIERLEAASGGDEVTLEELVLWSYAKEPFDAETQRRYDDFARRYERSRLCRLIEEAGAPERRVKQVASPGAQ